jgi:teichuronic acid biosynthesis glycosyltransferase TuaG
MKDLVSIIIPYYKKKLYIKRALNSLYNQTYQKFEIIIVYDDANLKELFFLQESIKKKHNIKIIVNKKNLGAGYSRNIGIKSSKGKFIAFLDADDYWHKNKLKIQINFMKKSKINFSFTSYKIVNLRKLVIKIIRAQTILSRKQLIKSCDIGLSTVMLKRSVLKVNKFPNIKTKEDYVLWLAISKKNTLYGIDNVLTTWQQSPNSLSSNTFQKIKDSYLVYNTYLKYGAIKSIISIFFLVINFLKKRYL